MSDIKNNVMPENYIYALDIGTRNVIGVIMSKEKNVIKIIDSEQMSHPSRAMFDGQIHEIESVANIVGIITSELEKRQGFKIKEVCIAAAGRALITNEIEIEKEIDPTVEIDKSILDILSIEAIQKSQKKVEEKRESKGYTNRYFCVGYSVIRYYLDDVEIKNPIEHRATKIKAILMTTFLPQSVVDSLNKVVEKVGLSVKNLTLEPIAAISVAIPESFRLLNLALVDVGAGTSDIAFTKQGTIFAYNMVDVAGDEITEAIMNEYLLDFNSADNLKIKLTNSQNEEITYKDIVGFENTIKREEIIEKMSVKIDEITSKIADTIIETNGNHISAVFLIGGGCKFPGFKEALASKLSLAENRVAIKTIDDYQNIEYSPNYNQEKLNGSENITVIGIGFNAFDGENTDFLTININDKTIKLFNSKELKVSDALIMQGYQPRQLLPSRGKSLNYFVNGKKILKQGGYGEIAKIFVNTNEADLNTIIKNKDVIVISPAQKGEDANVKISDIIEIDKNIKFNEKYIKLFYDIKINDKDFIKTDINYKINDGDKIEFKELKTLKDVLIYQNLHTNIKCFINEKEISNDYILKTFDNIVANIEESDLKNEQNINFEVTNIENLNNDNHLQLKTENTKNVLFNKVKTEDKDKLKRIDLFINGMSKTIKTSKNPFVFIDLFDYIDFDLSKPKGTISLKLNKKRANYTDIIKSGDEIEISWI